MIIDLGCGENKVANAIGVDHVRLPPVDVVHDLLSFPYPFDDSVADHVYLRHVIEHFALNHIQLIFAEVHRILRSGGTMHVHVPHVFLIAAWIDVTHKSFFTFGSADFWNRSGSKAYYLETTNIWQLVSTRSRVTILNWKRYRLRQLDSFLSQLATRCLNWLLKLSDAPGSADLIVKLLPLFFVEIQWQLVKER